MSSIIACDLWYSVLIMICPSSRITPLSSFPQHVPSPPHPPRLLGLVGRIARTHFGQASLPLVCPGAPAGVTTGGSWQARSTTRDPVPRWQPEISERPSIPFGYRLPVVEPPSGLRAWQVGTLGGYLRSGCRERTVADGRESGEVANSPPARYLSA